MNLRTLSLLLFFLALLNACAPAVAPQEAVLASTPQRRSLDRAAHSYLEACATALEQSRNAAGAPIAAQSCDDPRLGLGGHDNVIASRIGRLNGGFVVYGTSRSGLVLSRPSSPLPTRSSGVAATANPEGAANTAQDYLRSCVTWLEMARNARTQALPSVSSCRELPNARPLPASVRATSISIAPDGETYTIEVVSMGGESFLSDGTRIRSSLELPVLTGFRASSDDAEADNRTRSYLQRCVIAIETARNPVTQALPDVIACQQLPSLSPLPEGVLWEYISSLDIASDRYTITAGSASGAIFVFDGSDILEQP